jgi:hypothetical protein
MFGATGDAETVASAIEQAFLRIWNTAEVVRSGRSVLGGHAFCAPAVRAADSRLIGVDGEWGLYREAEAALPDATDRLFTRNGDAFRLATRSTGNIAVIDNASGTVCLGVDATGTFPLYYAAVGGGLVFSSLLRPLARAIGATRDDVATLEFLRQGYIVGGKTVFQGIQRLLPGQTLVFNAGRPPVIVETSRAWTASQSLDANAAAEVAWNELQRTLDRALAPNASALMMSGGWDSRTLLAAAARAVPGLSCYSHGDLRGRELHLVERLCSTAGVPCHLEPIDDRVLDLDAMSTGFDRVENLIFPHWHRAGRVLAETTACVASGVFGEILGGHYGPAMLAGGRGKIKSIASLLMGIETKEPGPGSEAAAAYLRIPHIGRHWYLDAAFEESIDRPLDRMNAEIDRARRRLEDRGVMGSLRQVEAFVSEHRGTQYINMQLLSCRAMTDVALPFAGSELFEFATEVPLTSKVHNSLNRIMLGRNAPGLLEYSMAATLVSARAPIWAQEASRLVRKVYEDGGNALEQRTRGRIPAPRLGWVNFDFLREGRALHAVVDDLACDFWNRQAMHSFIDAVSQRTTSASPHSLYDQMMKIYTVDRMLR